MLVSGRVAQFYLDIPKTLTLEIQEIHGFPPRTQPTIMAIQPTPPNVPPPRNKAL